MAVNYSPCPMYSMNSPDRDWSSSIWMADRYASERKANSFSKPEMEDYLGYKWTDFGDEAVVAREPTPKDILDLLPSDPFGMNLSATFTAIADWLEIESAWNLILDRAVLFESESESGHGERSRHSWGTDMWGAMGEIESENGSSLDGEFDPIWGTENFLSFRAEIAPQVAVSSQTQESRDDSLWDSEKFLCFNDDKASVASTSSHSRELRDDSVWDAKKFMSFSVEKASDMMTTLQDRELHERAESGSDGDDGAPHDALLLAFGYLEVQDLLSAERVCRSLRSAVQNDVLLWRNIHIDQPLSEKITDDDLLKMTARAQGSLQSLSLVDCSRITDDGIRRVLESNPRLTKLSVPGCTRITIGELVKNLKMFQSMGRPGLKCLRIGGLYGVTENQFEELRSLLNADNSWQPDARKPRFFHSGYFSPSNDDECPIDIEMCPRCEKLRLVYDCPRQSCQVKHNNVQKCRACTFCIARCVQCGRCINDSEYEETFCLEILCSGCLNQPVEVH